MPGPGNAAGRRRRRGSGVNVAAPQWMVTYSDMVTQLLAFFVILFSISSVDVQRFQELLSAFRASVGILETGRTFQRETVVGNPPIAISPNLAGQGSQAQLEQVYRELSGVLEAENVSADVQLVPEERGLVVRMADRVLFDLGKADLRPESQRVLSVVAGVLKRIPNPVRVEGHTDNLPIHNERFPSNWELSTARATTVVRYFIEKHGLEPRRLSAAGYGEYHPLVPNTSAANRQKNRRVDVVILKLGLTEEQAR
ncbi:MAG: OmpA family protein [Bacillota bacterium]